MKKQWIPLILMGISAMGWFAWKHRQPHQSNILTASGTLETTPIELASRLGGRVSHVLVQEGQLVKVNQTLIRLDARELEAQEQQVLAQQQALRAQLNLLQSGSRIEDIQSAQAAWQASELRVQEMQNGSRQAEKDRVAAEVATRQSQLNLAEKEYARLSDLVSASAASVQQLDYARQNLEMARQGLIQAEQNQSLIYDGVRQEEIAIAQQQARQQKAVLDKLKRGVRPQEIEAARANLRQVQAQFEQLQIRLQEASLVSPCQCQISLLGVQKGELVNAGTPVVSLLDKQDLWVKVYLSPLELNRVRLNQKVHLTVDAWPGQTFVGQVVYISSQAEFTPRNIQTREERIHQVFAIKIAVKDPQSRLFAGMPVDVNWPSAQGQTAALSASANE